MDIKIQAETDFMGEVIAERNQQIGEMAELMGDINELAKDINTEVLQQGEKL